MIIFFLLLFIANTICLSNRHRATQLIYNANYITIKSRLLAMITTTKQKRLSNYAYLTRDTSFNVKEFALIVASLKIAFRSRA